MHPPIDPRLNNPHFRFREIEINRILAQWQAGESVLLTGIRRTGKSELMKAALFRHAQNGQGVAYLDVQAEDSLARFYQNLLQALLNNLPKTVQEKMAQWFNAGLKIPTSLMLWVRQHVKSLNLSDVAEIELQDVPNAPPDQLVHYWQPIVEQIAGFLKLHAAGASPVIGIDEMPFMLENMYKKQVPVSDMILMLASLRTLRDSGLRLIIGGSVSFENILSLYGIPHTVLGGLFRLPVAPFSREEASSYLKEVLATRYAGSPDAVEHILNTLPDYVPEVLKIAKGYLITCLDQAACEACLTNEVMPAVRRSFLQQFNERLDKNYSAQQLQCAEQILDCIARAEAQGTRLNGSELPQGYQHVLNLLQYDNFIVDAPDFSWRFSLQLIRLWWRGTRGIA